MVPSKETDRWDEYSFEHIKPANEIKVIDYHAVNNIQCERNNEQLRLLTFKDKNFLLSILQKFIAKKERNNDILQFTSQQLMYEYQNRLDSNPIFCL